MITKYLISKNKTVKDAVSYMEENGLKYVLIVDERRKLLGMFSLGDMRKFFLNGGELAAPLTDAMNQNPIVFPSMEVAKNEMDKRHLMAYPIVDNRGVLVDIMMDGITLSERILSNDLAETPVVIMAGGKGTRLYPYTEILPKPLIPIGEKTITERIIENFSLHGCKDYYLILNHKASMICSYFDEIEKDYNLGYFQEKEFLGTGGGLALLKGQIDSAFFLSNCDVLINADLDCIYKTHKKEGRSMTFVCAMRETVLPYGVVKTDEEGNVNEIQEKPEFSFLTNTGVYLIEPEVIDEIAEGECIDMTDLARRLIDHGKKVGVFPISDKSWMDMGQIEELENMKKRMGVE